jgi:hypothetical protein
MRCFPADINQKKFGKNWSLSMRCLGSESTKSSEVKELFHGDFLVFGSACCFFVCLDDLAVSDSHRVRKLPAWWALGMKERTKVMQEILDSDATSKELQVGWPKNTVGICRVLKNPVVWKV